MYADGGLLYPYFQNLYHDEQLEDLYYSHSQKPTSSIENTIQISTISDYDLGGEGDLFKAPEPIIEEPIVDIDPMTAAIAMISCGDDVMHQPVIEDIDSLQNESLLSDVFDGCRNEFLEKTSMETTVSDVFDIKFPVITTNEVQTENNKPHCDLSFTKCGSSGSLSSLEWVSNATVRPNFLDFSELELGAAYGMRRAFSEGDIKALGNGNINLIHSPVQRSISEDRLQKLSRYRNKRSRRNFGRKIKYACRKALADSQPRIRGRFAKTEDTESCKSQQTSNSSRVYAGSYE